MAEAVLSAVNAAPAANIEPQTTETVKPEATQEAQPETQKEQTIETVQPEPDNKTKTAEPVKPQQDKGKPVQSPEVNAQFAEQRRAREAAEAKAARLERDYNVAKDFGAVYGVFSEADIAGKYGQNGITTYEQMAEAVRAAEMKEKGIDPEAVRKYAEELPEVKQARQAKRTQEEWNAFTKEFPDVKVTDIPPEVLIEYDKGKPLTDAYALYEARQTRIQKAKALEDAAKAKANEANAKAAMGSVETAGNTNPEYISAEDFEKNRSNDIWVRKNFNTILKSRAKW